MNPRYRFRIVIIMGLLAIGYGAVVAKLVYLQLLTGPRLEALAVRQRQGMVSLKPERGNLLDRRGKALAVSLEAASVYAHPEDVVDVQGTARALAPLLQLKPAEVQRQLVKDRPFVWLRRQVDPPTAEGVRGLERQGVHLVSESKRFYPRRQLSGHLLGFVGLDNQGLEGVELAYNEALNGEGGWVLVEKDAKGRGLTLSQAVLKPPSAGLDVRLTIDEVIQYVVEKELSAQVAATQARGGLAVVVEPSSGAVLAMARVPSFNPNSFSRFHPGQWRNRAITDPYEPGSTFKLLVAAAALESGLVREGDRLFCEEGAITVKGVTIRDHKDFGWLTFADVIARSSNVGAIKVAQKVGPERLYRYARAFGVGQKTGIDLPGEQPGLLRSPREWSGLSLASLAIGQEVAATPLQMLMAYAAVANGGILKRPYVIDAFLKDGRVRWRAQPRVIRRVVAPSIARRLTKLLVRVVDQGTGRAAAVEGYTVAGKTGTAQKFDLEAGRYARDRYVASFIGFAPAKSPAFAMLVLVDEPRGTVYGGTVAAPVFARAARQILRYLHIPT
ncbi:MAG: peptidoglycan D,D-transpeptidase FtsI family protein, partial [Candidatus Tectimicrobiota bacterium]